VRPKSFPAILSTHAAPIPLFGKDYAPARGRPDSLRPCTSLLLRRYVEQRTLLGVLTDRQASACSVSLVTPSIWIVD
jgi:hypothetical protein